MSDTIYISPVKIDVRPYPWWERFRVAFECLVFGHVSFRGTLDDVKVGDK